jgi:hypothetical protein
MGENSRMITDTNSISSLLLTKHANGGGSNSILFGLILFGIVFGMVFVGFKVGKKLWTKLKKQHPSLLPTSNSKLM